MGSIPASHERTKIIYQYHQKPIIAVLVPLFESVSSDQFSVTREYEVTNTTIF